MTPEVSVHHIAEQGKETGGVWGENRREEATPRDRGVRKAAGESDGGPGPPPQAAYLRGEEALGPVFSQRREAAGPRALAGADGLLSRGQDFVQFVLGRGVGTQGCEVCCDRPGKPTEHLLRPQQPG